MMSGSFERVPKPLVDEEDLIQQICINLPLWEGALSLVQAPATHSTQLNIPES